jgi:hypothetical protein
MVVTRTHHETLDDVLKQGCDGRAAVTKQNASGTKQTLAHWREDA